MNQNEGIRKGIDGSYEFCKTMDLPTDIIYLKKDNSGVKITNSLTYFYAYEFNPNLDNSEVKEFRTAIKHNLSDTDLFDGEVVFDFVEDGLFRFDSYKKLSDFKVVVMSETSQFSLLTILDSLLYQYTDGEITSIKMIKNLCKDVIFDREKARKALFNTDKYGSSEIKINKALDSIEKLFRKFQNTTNVFKMKLYSPVVARVGFTNIFRFKNKEQENLYKELESGTEVLICDDFITSGSTVKEIMNVLNSVNPNNRLTVFILINQLKTY